MCKLSFISCFCVFIALIYTQYAYFPLLCRSRAYTFIMCFCIVNQSINYVFVECTVKNFRILTDIFSKKDTELVRTLQFRLLTERQSTCNTSDYFPMSFSLSIPLPFSSIILHYKFAAAESNSWTSITVKTNNQSVRQH